MLEIVERIACDNRIIGCNVKESNGEKHFIAKNMLAQYQYSNATITVDNKVQGVDIPIVNVIALYHGSHNGIIGSISVRYSRTRCDFGRGFYTGDMEKQAKMLIAGDACGKFYTLHAKIRDLNIYKFKDDVLWALYVGVNRGHIDVKRYPKLMQLCKQIDQYDVVSGLIADDKMMFVYTQFITGNITDKALIACLSQVKLGNQYVFKNDRACTAIDVVSNTPLTQKEIRVYTQEKRGMLLNIDNTVEYLKRTYRRQGMYVDEILEKYK